MAVVVILPKQGQLVESCIITEIKKKKGDTVKKGDVLFTYETDKASFEEESPVDGMVLESFYNAGDEVAVLSDMMLIGQPSKDYAGLLQGGSPTVSSEQQNLFKMEDENIKKIEEAVSPQFVEYVQLIIQDILQGYTTLNKQKKWLEKYCDYENLDPQNFLVELSDFLELIVRFSDKSDKLMLKMLNFQAERIYLSPEDIENFLPKEIFVNDIIKKSSGSGIAFSSGFISYGLDLI